MRSGSNTTQNGTKMVHEKLVNGSQIHNLKKMIVVDANIGREAWGTTNNSERGRGTFLPIY